jgi:hypothetical protein
MKGGQGVHQVLPHRVDKGIEGVARQGGHMMLVCTIVIPINWNLWKDCLCRAVVCSSARGASMPSILATFKPRSRRGPTTL